MNHSDHKQYITAYNLIKDKNPSAFKPQIQPQAYHGSNYNNPFYGDNRNSGGKTAFGLNRNISNLIIDHYARRQNTRSIVDKSPQARTILKRYNDSIIGNGPKLNPTPDFETIGITREEAEKWGKDVKNRFHLWAKSKKSDLTGRNNFYQNSRLYGWQLGRDGEVFLRFTYSKDKSLLNPLQISFIDANQIRGDEYTFSSGPESQDDGIIKDENGQEIGYKVWITDPKNMGRYKDVEIPAVDKKSGLPLMIHGFEAEWAGQTRGIPEISYAIQEFQDITGFSTATVKKAINGASLGFTVKNMQQDPSSMNLEALDSARAGAPIITDGQTPSQAPVNLGVDAVQYRNIPEGTMSESGYNLLSGNQGDELKSIDSNSPAEHTGDYIDSLMKYLTTLVSMPLSIATMKFDKSHSASRGELGLFADVKEIKKDDIASDYLDLAYGAWISGEIGSGRIKAPGFSDPLLREAWLQNTWITNPLPDVDPLKTKMAVKLAAELGLTDLGTEAMLSNGSSFEANSAKLTRQIEDLPTDPFELKEIEQEQETEEQEEE